MARLKAIFQRPETRSGRASRNDDDVLEDAGRTFSCAETMSGVSVLWPLSRHCHSNAGGSGRFLENCGFPVIYFVANIFFPRPWNSTFRPRVHNGRLRDAVNI
jgi:hypothetical protein